MIPFDAKLIQQNGWRQGSILENVTPIAPAYPSDALGILLSHDCDIVQQSIEKEPFVEILIAVPTEELDGNYTRGKNSRCYHFDFCDKHYEIRAIDRVSAPRELLVDHEPGIPALSDDEIKGIVHWFAQRYERPAFPDNFNIRLSRKTKQVIERVLKKSGYLISGVYISCSQEELSDDEFYNIFLYVVMTVEDFENIEKAGACEDMAQQILDSINKHSRGIRVGNAEDMCINEKDLSLHDLHTTKRFTSFDYMSFDSEMDTLT